MTVKNDKLIAIAIDDEPVALEVMESLVSKISFLNLTACFAHPLVAAEFLRKNSVDLVFLDIQMPDLSGIELIESLNDQRMVIFTTAYADQAVKSFELNAIDYLLKPFSFTRLLKACNKANELYELKKNAATALTQNQSIFVKSGYDHVRVELQNIRYAESMGNYMKFVLNDSYIIGRITMNELEKILPNQDFLRIHRSYLVAKSLIDKVDRKSVWLGKLALPFGRAYLSIITEFIKIHKSNSKT